MKKEQQEHADSPYKKDDAEEKNQRGSTAGRKNKTPESEQENDEDIDYSKLDVDESTGGSAMAEAEEDE